ncbi:MAG: DUF5615 family PIN-like protein [Cyanobacteriota bacterium]|nr:DUF5615 family PIN-like protein [Cyanobacteriota bacterium]
MSLKYLLDENVDPVYKNEINRRNPDIIIWVVGEPLAPPRGTLDPEILYWCEEYDFVLVTNNRASMPGHLIDHIREGRHVPGIFTLGENISIGENINELTFIAEASFEDEYRDTIVYLPKIK